MAVLWIYLLAAEVVGIVTMIGSVSGLSDTILGLTLIAWSNSLGDLVNDVTVARQGRPRMAISACIGGPLFSELRIKLEGIGFIRADLLIGVGASFSIAAFRHGTIIVRSFPSHILFICIFQVTLSPVLVVLFSAQLWSLLSSSILLPLSRFWASRMYAVYMLCVYLVFIVVIVLAEKGVL